MNEGLEQLIPWVNAVGVPGLLAVGLYALHKGWIITGREHQRAYEDCVKIRLEDLKRYDEMKAERDEWKAAALRNLNVAERAVQTVARTAETVSRTGGA
jgi:hypothetical protein